MMMTTRTAFQCTSGIFSFIAIFLLSTYYLRPAPTRNFLVNGRDGHGPAGEFLDDEEKEDEEEEEVKGPSSSSCTAKANVFFLKTHKCASSTVQNVLMRYGLKRNLNFVLPTSGHHLSKATPFRRWTTAAAPWNSLGYNIFCHHAVYDEAEVTSLMPADTVYVSVVRHPVDLFESLYSYARLDRHYRQEIEEFARTRNASLDTYEDRADRGHLGVNQMLFDFGVRPADFGNASVIGSTLAAVERRFALIMLAERFDESMVLLQDLLCWTLDDVVYFVHNARQTVKKRRLSDDVRRLLSKLNAADFVLYEHFRKRFRRQVLDYGPKRMKAQVAQLRKRVAKMHKYCATDDTEPLPSVTKVPSPLDDMIEAIRVIKGNATCSQLALREVDFTNRLRMRQLLRAMHQKLYINGSIHQI